MSEEKLYAVKDAEGQYWDFEFGKFRPVDRVYHPADFDKEHAKAKARDYDGHVVTLIEEPEKVALSKEQAEIVEGAHYYTWPAKYITDHCGNSNGLEELLMNAYVNGFTVAKEKKYRVKVPETQTSYYYKGSDGHVHASDTSGGLDNEFSYSELQQYGLDGERFTKEEVTDDGMGC
ncbi:DUF1642 domain-containing protein [Lacticaseibacillus paracasei]|uniref:DUF1642 domain-containing protein n=1 Tax=Lacticaseibacillus paracasei TaxID=1597 RepID=UPI003B9A56C4